MFLIKNKADFSIYKLSIMTTVIVFTPLTGIRLEVHYEVVNYIRKG